MNTKIKASAATSVMMALFVFDSRVCARGAIPPPSSPPGEPNTDKPKSEQAKNQASSTEAAKPDAEKPAAQTEATAQPPQAPAAVAKPAPAPRNFWHQEEVTSNWSTFAMTTQ